MSDADNINKFSAEDILRYQQGLLSPKERHAMEKAALEDPFLADALEGYAATNVGATDLQDLQLRLQSRVQSGKVIHMGSGRSGFPWLRIAAVFVLLAGAGIPAYVYLFRQPKGTIAQQTEQKAAPQNNGQTDKKAIPDTSKTVTGTTVIVSDSNTSLNNTSPATVKSDYRNLPAAEPLERVSVNPPAAGKSIPDSSRYLGLKDLADKQNQADDFRSTELKSRRATANANPEFRFDKKETAAGSQPFTINANTKADSLRNDPSIAIFRESQSQKNNPKGNNGITYTFNNFRGRVTDNNNNPLPFANITNLEDNVGTYSDARGFFNLTSPDTVLNVQVRSLGFNVSNLELRNNLSGNQITLQEDKSLNALVLNTKKPNADLHARSSNQQLTEPEPSDGWDNYDTYLANNLNIPDEYRNQKTNTGTEVEVSFEVDKNGEPVNIRVERSLCSSCDKEAIRLIKEGPKWKRKAKNGRTTVRISF